MANIFYLVIAIALSSLAIAAGKTGYPDVTPGRAIEFPRDEGSHPEFRVEWWYVTGWINGADKRERGFQITFFRARPDNVAADNPSKFSPQQILFAHVALSDPSEGKLLHAQRTARAGLGLAEAKTGLTHVWIQDWSLQQKGNRYHAKIAAPQFTFDFQFEANAQPMLNGLRGYSQKAPNPLAASYYYSIPQLKLTGSLKQRGKNQIVTGTAWLDHEWSSEYMDPRAAGWDWAGVNFDDGGALMAFRMRDHSGKTLWASGTYRDSDGTISVFAPKDISFKPLKTWRSPRTGAIYPVACTIRAGNREYELQPLFDDQELDSGGAIRAVYWEGAVRVKSSGNIVGRGYLELTGYSKPLKF
jgi:predicted secreted hydrolase